MSPATDWTFAHCPTPPAWSLDWPAILRALPVLGPLADCPQDPRWHAEGDVLTHTRMVCEALIAMESWRTLPPSERSIVFIAALLHDIAKPRYTQHQPDGSITSRGHSLAGAYDTRAMIFRAQPAQLAAPFDVRERIAALVRFHGLPLSLLDKPDPVRAVIGTSMTARNDHLAILAEADARGRTCPGQQELIDRTHLFREFCREQACLDTPRPFASDHARFTYFADGRSGPDYVPHDANPFEVTLMSGLPRAGKDHYARRHLTDYPVISLDAIRADLGIDPADEQGTVIARAKEQARAHLRARQPFVWNATNVTRFLRAPLIAFFAGYGARVRIVYVETDYSTLTARNAAACRVPRAVIQRLIDKLDPPDPTEAHTVEYVLSPD